MNNNQTLSNKQQLLWAINHQSSDPRTRDKGDGDYGDGIVARESDDSDDSFFFRVRARAE